MTQNQNPIVLIGWSKNFANQRLFTDKLANLLSNLASYDVIVVGEGECFNQDLEAKSVIRRLGYKEPLRSIDKIVDSVDYVILFWDGKDISDYVYSSILNKKRAKIIPVETTKVVNKDRGDNYDIYIGRGTPWGNPFAIGDQGMNRDEVILKFKEHFYEVLLKDEAKKREILTLKGKVLGCHCKPYACHGDVIAEYLNSLDDSE